MRRTAALGAVLAALLSACSTPRPTPADYIEVVGQVVRDMDQDARSQGLGRPPRGPLWVDVRGFAGRAFEVTGIRVSKDTILAALRPAAREAEPRQVLLAAGEEDMLGGTWVREYGVHVSPNAARGSEDQITMLVANYSTDRRAMPTDICERVWRMRFRKQPDGRWLAVERALARPCPGQAAP